jgi:flagellar hook-associated protein 3 FlgL
MSAYRISTPGQHSALVAQMLQQQVRLARTQAQVASGSKILSPADDPVGATRIIGIERAQAQLVQYGKNAGIAGDRLKLGEQSLADLNTVLQRVRELTLQANSGAIDDVSLKSIATELKARAGELQQIANRQDGNGEYLFAGFSTGTQPFPGNGGNIAYAGDQGVRKLQISSSQSIADGLQGQQVFMDIPEGNGTFIATAGNNAGTGILGVQQVLDHAQWNAAGAAAAAAIPPRAHAYTVRFTDPNGDGRADSWELLDANGNAVLDNGAPPAPVTGTYSDGGAITFDGVQFTMTGQPAVGDTFAVRPAGTESMFRTLDDLINAVSGSSATPQQRAALGNSVSKALAQLDQGMSHAIDLRTEIGARLSQLDTAESLREDVGLTLASSLSELKDLDYAQAISTLNQQMTGLQAAQAAYARIGQMSLFDYLR